MILFKYQTKPTFTVQVATSYTVATHLRAATINPKSEFFTRQFTKLLIKYRLLTHLVNCGSLKVRGYGNTFYIPFYWSSVLATIFSLKMFHLNIGSTLYCFPKISHTKVPKKHNKTFTEQSLIKPIYVQWCGI